MTWTLTFDGEHFRVNGKRCVPKQTADGLLAVKRGGFWQYFRLNTKKNEYERVGSTLRLEAGP